MQHSVWLCFCLRWVWLCCYHPDSFVRLCVSSAVGRMWHTGRGSLALSDPGKLCHPVIIPSLPVCSQPAHRRGDHHHGYWLSRVCRSCQRESSSAADGKWFFPGRFLVLSLTLTQGCVDAASSYSYYSFLLLFLAWKITLTVPKVIRFDIVNQHEFDWRLVILVCFMKALTVSCCFGELQRE